MTTLTPVFGSTSAEGRAWSPPSRSQASTRIEPMLIHLATSAVQAPLTELLLEIESLFSLDQTTPGTPVRSSVHAGGAIAELRRSSGLTWDQLARLFDVSRRALHFWASGKPMTASNEEHLQRLIALVRSIDRGSASANRVALLTPIEGVLPFDLLVRRDYDRASKLIGESGIVRQPPPKLGTAAMRARMPLPPEVLVGATQDRDLPETGRLRATTPVRKRRRD